MTARHIVRALVVAVFSYVVVVTTRSRSLRWGATPEERDAHLSGDDRISNADLTSTRVCTIRARPEAVWPWVAQLGQGRGGFYSYDALENLAGCDIHSANRVVPEWQHARAGDAFKLHPDVALVVDLVDPPRALVVRGGIPVGNRAAPYDFTWAFVVRDAHDGTTRLLIRERYAYSRWWAPLLVEPVEVVSFVMSQRMLRGIRDRAERIAKLTPARARAVGLDASHHGGTS